MRLRPFIGVVGTLLIVPQNAKGNTGTKSINECADENDEISETILKFDEISMKNFIREKYASMLEKITHRICNREASVANTMEKTVYVQQSRDFIITKFNFFCKFFCSLRMI